MVATDHINPLMVTKHRAPKPPLPPPPRTPPTPPPLHTLAARDRRGMLITSEAARPAPEDHGRISDLFVGIETQGAHGEIAAEGSAMVLAHAVAGPGILDGADIFGERGRIEKAGALVGLR